MEKNEERPKNSAKLNKDQISAAFDVVKSLFDLAKELQKEHDVASKFSMAGNVLALIGSGVGFAASVATGGLATPLVVAGAVATITGTATSITAEAIDSINTKDKLAKAQSKLDKFRLLMFGTKKAVQRVGGVVQACEALGKVWKNGKAARNVKRIGQPAKTFGKALPVLTMIFAVMDVADIVRYAYNGDKSEAAQLIINMAKKLAESIK